MTEKILILYREKNSLEIQDEDNESAYAYIQSITHIEKDNTEYGTEHRVYDIFLNHIQMGFVTQVKEIKEVWCNNEH